MHDLHQEAVLLARVGLAGDSSGDCAAVGLSEGGELPFFDPSVLPTVKAAPQAKR